MKRGKSLAFGLACLLLLAACAHRRGEQKYSEAELFGHLPPVAYEIPGYSKYLEGVRICLDPGHGGDAHLKGYKQGPTGVREAEMNWTVAQFMKGFLESVGAEVILTRDGDEHVSLADRCKVANEAKVDFFISLHHNAAGRESANFTSTWYHADPDYGPMNLDLARYIQQGVADALWLPETAPNPLKSDYLMYPGAGFGVLRRLEVPGCLCEASFFSNYIEEQRLRDAEYLKREAYGYFLGISRFVAAGLPRSALIQPEPGAWVQEKQPEVVVELNDGLRDRGGWGSDRNWIFADSIRVRLDGKAVKDDTYDPASKSVRFTPAKKLANGVHKVEVAFRNLSGNHARPVAHAFTVASPAARIVARAWPETLHPDGVSYAQVSFEVTDAEGTPVADGTSLTVAAEGGTLESRELKTKGGKAYTYIHSGLEPGTLRVSVRAEEVETAVKVPVSPEGPPLIYGTVLDEGSDKPVEGVRVRLTGPKKNAPEAQISNTEGRVLFVAEGYAARRVDLRIAQPGYYRRSCEVDLRKGQHSYLASLAAYPVAGGLLQGKTILLDPQGGGSEPGGIDSNGNEASDLNLAVAGRLAALLEAAGAKARLIRTEDVFISSEQRVEIANDLGGDRYLRIAHALADGATSGVRFIHYPGLQGQRRARKSSARAARELGLSDLGAESSRDVEIQKTKMLADGVCLYTLDATAAGDFSDPGWIDLEAYAVYQGLLAQMELPERYAASISLRTIDAGSGLPLGHAEVLLDGTLPRLTDARGQCRFSSIVSRFCDLTARKEGYRPVKVRLSTEDPGVFILPLRRE